LEQLNGDLQEMLKERQQAQHALLVSEQQFKTLAKASPVGIVHTDAQVLNFANVF
jgi:PAS domain-containing protein